MIAIKRRAISPITFLRGITIALVLLAALEGRVASADGGAENRGASKRPNILIAIADDQSYPHTSAYGDPAIKTPAFDRVARDGVLFRNAFTPAPGCSPMRAAFLTGREIWQIGHAGTHASFFPRELPVFTEQLADSGYHVGMTGKGWGPGRAIGWPHNPAGKSYTGKKMKSPQGISATDYAGNFETFLDARDSGKPFCFWFGCHEPHRVYGVGLGASNGVDPSKVNVPKFLPDSDVIRNDLADYLFEIQWFDSHLMRMIQRLEEDGELENTIVIVTSDNGMPFPRAKANCYEYGIHMPLAIAWPKQWPRGQTTDDLVSLIDVTRTILDAGRITPKESEQLSGISLRPFYTGVGKKIGRPREYVFSGRERHSSSRFRSLGYPIRCVRSPSHLYIRNFKPERWPAGAPRKFDGAKFNEAGQRVAGKLGPERGGYHDIDNGPTLRWMIEHRDDADVGDLLAASVEHRPAEELYDIRSDPECLVNLAEDSGSQKTKEKMNGALTAHLERTGDLRQTNPDAADLWETYPRVSSLRWFETPGWASEHPERIPEQDWLEQRRPKK